MSKHFDNLVTQLDKLARHNRQGSFRTRQRYYEAVLRFCRFLAGRYRLERLANIAPKHIFAYVEFLQAGGKAPSTIKTDLAAIRFFHDLMPSPRYELPNNSGLFLQRRTIGGIDRTWSAPEFNRMLVCALAAGREDYITILYLGRYAALRIHECFRMDTATAAKAIKGAALTIKGKGGLVRTVPLNTIVTDRLKKHLETTPRGQKLFVLYGKPTHKAIKDFQTFLTANRLYAQDAGSTRPMTFHGLRHTQAAEWYVEFTKQGQTPYQARKAVSKLLGHGRDDVTRIYLASLGREGGADGK